MRPILLRVRRQNALVLNAEPHPPHVDPQAIRDRPDHPSAAIIDAIVAHHTMPQQAAEVFRRVAPRLAVYSHAPNTERILAQTRTAYAGPLEGAEDLLTIFVGTQIKVVHHPALQQ